MAKVLIYYGMIPDAIDSEYKIVCPFHGDVNPSMKIDLIKGTFYCFGCGITGNALSFVVEMEKGKKNSLQACKLFVKILKMKKIQARVRDFKNNVRAPREDNAASLAEANDYYSGLKKVDWRKTRSYDLVTSEELIRAKSYMRKRGFNSCALNKCKAKVTYNKSYGLIFPMMDNGKFKGWVCRTMVKEIEKKRKYLYNKGFSRASTLVGDYKGKDVVYIVEGYMDRLKFVQYGCDRAIAILGWKITNEQIAKLKEQGITTIVSALDNDTCGRKGTKYLQKYFNVVRWKYIKGIKDPGEMNEDLFRRMYDKTQEFIE